MSAFLSSIVQFFRKPSVLGPFAAFGYGIISISITFFNKAVLSSYDFKFGNALMLAQMIASLCFLPIMRKHGFISYKDPTIAVAKQCVLLALFFVAMVVLSLVALPFVNIPVYNTLRRFSTLLVIIIEHFWLKKDVAKDELASVLLMVAGAVVAYMGDLTFSFIGYTLTILSTIANAGYLVCIRFTKERTKCGEFEMMFYNNVLSIPFVVPLVLGLELDGLIHFQYWLNPGFILCFFMSAVLAFLLNYFLFLCSTVNSPLTTSVTGQVKAILSVVIGLFFFGDVIVTPLLLFGLGISCAGSIYYAVIKYRQAQARAKPSQLPTVISDTKKDEEAKL